MAISRKKKVSQRVVKRRNPRTDNDGVIYLTRQDWKKAGELIYDRVPENWMDSAPESRDEFMKIPYTKAHIEMGLSGSRWFEASSGKQLSGNHSMISDLVWFALTK